MSGRTLTWVGDRKVIQEPPPVTFLTKLQIRDEAMSIDPALWAGIVAFIEADAERLERWNLAVSIPVNDPILDQVQDALGWSDAQRQGFIDAAGAR